MLNALTPSTRPPLDRLETALAGPLLLATADAELRESLERDLETLGCQVVAVGSASALLARLAQPGRAAPVGILLDDALSAGAPKARAALLSAVEAATGSLARVVPLVSPNELAWSGPPGEGRELAKPVSRWELRQALSRLQRLAPCPESSLPAVSPPPARRGDARWLRPKRGAAQFPGEEWLYPALLARFRERCSDTAPRLAALLASGDYGELARLLGQIASGAHHLGADPLADVAATLADVVRQGRWTELPGRLQDLQEALVATFAAAGRHLSGRTDEDLDDEPSDATPALGELSVA